MPDLTVGRVALGSPPAPQPNIFKAALDEADTRTRDAEEMAAEYKRLLASVYSYCASDVRAYGGPELDREVRAALGLPVTDADE
jgi:hypothetical protein